MLYGLVGENLVYSYSKLIHEKLGEYKYQLFSLNREEFKTFITNKQYNGLNITVPYKKEVMPYCDDISEIAQKIGSVNTVCHKNGRLYGTNTDYTGFLYMMRSTGINLNNKKVLILGAGGTSLTVQKCAKDQRAREIVVAARNHDFSKDYDSEIIINTTPVGTYPNNGESLIDLNCFPRCEGVLDVIYNPFSTDLLLRAKERDLAHSNGLPMLVSQATAAAELFTGQNFEKQNEEIILWLQKKLQNIVLIGMPGCGKSTIGQKLGEALGKEFVDMDAVIEKDAGMSIPDIFERFGESHFRDLESKTAKEIGKKQSQIIAAGGGAVLRAENMDALRQNAVVFFLSRPIDQLETQGRPLSTGIDALKSMEKKRLPLYIAYSDYTIQCDKPVEESTAAILQIVKSNQ